MNLQIKKVVVLEGSPPEAATEWGKHSAYPSPDGRRILWLEDLGEFAMGARHYGLRLGNSAATFDEAADLKLPDREKAHIHRPHYYQPWSFGSRKLLICPYGDSPILLDPGTRQARGLGIGKGSLVAGLCSPTRPYAFFAPRARNENACFVALDGDLSPSTVVSGPALYSHAVWIGDWLLFLQQEPQQQRATLKLLDAANPQAVAEADVSPSRLLPYDNSALRQIRINEFRSVVGPARWGSGFPYLDVWGGVQYLAAEHALLLRVGRPAGAPERNSWLLRTYTVPIQFVWARIELDLEAALQV